MRSANDSIEELSSQKPLLHLLQRAHWQFCVLMCICLCFHQTPHCQQCSDESRDCKQAHRKNSKLGANTCSFRCAKCWNARWRAKLDSRKSMANKGTHVYKSLSQVSSARKGSCCRSFASSSCGSMWFSISSCTSPTST